MKELIIILLLVLMIDAMAITKVGNGNDGEDLRNFTKVDRGILIESRNEAVSLLEKLNVENLPGLSSLVRELERSEIYLAKSDLTKKQIKELGGKEGDKDFYARTFPRPHAATRFFPKSLMLSRKDLVTLHIHEALHRALPTKVRENEEYVENLAESITSPGARYSDLKQIVGKMELGSKDIPQKSYSQVSFEKYKPEVVERSKLNSPSSFGLTQSVIVGKDKNGLVGVTTLSSHLYPFGRGRHALGVGVDASFFEGKKESFLGPLGVSGRLLLFSVRGFDIEGFGEAKIKTSSANELEHTFLDRNIYRFGLGMKYGEDKFYVANDLSYTLKSESSKTIGPVSLKAEYGEIIGVKVKAGHRIKSFDLGVFSELFISEGMNIVEDSGFQEFGDTLRVVNAGPEITYNMNNFQIELKAKFKIDSTKDVSLSALGDVFGVGSGNGQVSLGMKYNF